MKTHEFAKSLIHLARVLRAGPNIEFEDMTNLSTYVSQPRQTKPSREVANDKDRSEKGTGLALLAEMASYSKQDLLSLIDELGIPVEVRKADAVRDILGKALKFLQENPDFKERIAQSSSDKRPVDQQSPLARALAILMSQP